MPGTKLSFSGARSGPDCARPAPSRGTRASGTTAGANAHPRVGRNATDFTYWPAPEDT
jgi:hypothetical protein